MIWNDGAFWWLFRWFGVMIHDDGWIVINSRRVEVLRGGAPNTGYNRKWWKAL